jgi:heat shock protein HslJ
MKYILVLAFFMTIGNLAIAKRMNPLIEWQGVWQIKSMANIKGKLELSKSKEREVIIESSQSNMNINFGCNSMNAKINGVGRDNVTFGFVMSTKMGCPTAIAALENRIGKILPLIDKYKIVNSQKGIELIFYQGLKKLIVLKKTNKDFKSSASTFGDKEESPIGKYRIIQQLENNEMTERNLIATSFILGSDGDKQYSANVGCNSINGSLIWNKDNTITFEPGITTQMGCMGDVDKCEKNFLKNLFTITKWKKEANHLFLYQRENLVMMLEHN